MLNKREVSVFIVLAMVFAMVFIACDPGGGEEGEYRIGGEGPGGGIVFYFHPDGFYVEGYGEEGQPGYFEGYFARYLEAAPVDLEGSPWAFEDHSEIDEITTFEDDPEDYLDIIGNGRKDTMSIVAHQKDIETDTAALRAAAANFGGNADWFLPSLGELYLLYIHKDDVGITGMDIHYWSSSQNNFSGAWAVYFNGGGYYNYGKNSTHAIRPIRAFW